MNINTTMTAGTLHVLIFKTWYVYGIAYIATDQSCKHFGEIALGGVEFKKNVDI